MKMFSRLPRSMKMLVLVFGMKFPCCQNMSLALITGETIVLAKICLMLLTLDPNDFVSTMIPEQEMTRGVQGQNSVQNSVSGGSAAASDGDPQNDMPGAEIGVDSGAGFEEDLILLGSAASAALRDPIGRAGCRRHAVMRDRPQPPRCCPRQERQDLLWLQLIRLQQLSSSIPKPGHKVEFLSLKSLLMEL
jgi:hypothetical protein